MNIRAISPVIATVIIVSVAIAIAVAVAFWMTGITGLFTRYEKLEVINAYATKDTDFTVYVYVRNAGTSDATIDNIFINGKPPSNADVKLIKEVSAGTVFQQTQQFKSIGLTTGGTATITIILDGTKYESGQIVEIKLHTAAGNEYPKSVQLP